MRPGILALLALLLPRAAVAADPAPAAELEAYTATLDRYRDRAAELLEEAAAEVDAHEIEQRKRVEEGYLRLQAQLEQQEALYRKQAEGRLEAFLSKYPRSPETADMKFRLADLYFEDAELAYFDANEDYTRLEEQAEKNPDMVLPPPPSKDYARSMALFQEIVTEHPDYANLPDTWYMLAWCYGAMNARQYDAAKALATYETVANRYPGSPYANDANLWIGEYWFDLPVAVPPGTPPDKVDLGTNVRTAIGYYETVLRDGPTGRNYDEAIYKLGWSHFKLNDYDKALAYMVQLLDYSDAEFARTGRASNMRPEAIQYLAISYADIADRQGKAPTAVAQAHFAKVGERKWEHDVVERLAEILLVQARFEEAIATFEFLQQRWPLDPKNPVYQHRVAMTWGTMPIPDPAKAAAALAVLSERYSEGTRWYQANRGNPDAIATARGFIETSLVAVAVEHLARARETGSVDDYATAAAKFDSFLNSFPLATDYDLYEWYRALSYFGAREFTRAEAAYAQILKNERSPYRDGSRFQILKCREAVLLEKFGAFDKLPDGAIVEKVVTSPAGKQYNQYAIATEHRQFVASADDLADRAFAPGEWADALAEVKPALIYIPGQIYYVHGHYEEARKRFDRLIALYPRTDEAVYASSLYVNSLATEGNLEAVRVATSRFLGMQLGKNPEVNRVNLAELTDIREQAAFGLALELVKKEDRAGAATAFMAFLKEYPNSKFYKEALYNAANSYSLAGNAGEAIRLFEQYVARYPTDEQSQFLYTRIAENYSATMDLQRAIANYDLLVKTFPNSPDAPAAIYNAAFLRVGLQDHAAAARGYERYATSFPDQPDAEDAYFKAGAQWELVGANEALEFYGRYLKRYPSQNPSHVIEALSRTAALANARRDTRRVAAANEQILQVYAAAGGQVGDDARALVAQVALADLLAAFERYKAVKWTTSEAKNVEILTKVKAEEQRALEAQSIALIATYRDFDSAAAALYVQGMSYFAFADMAYDIPPPKGLSDEELDLYRTTVDERFRLPAEDKGKARLVQALEKAAAEKRWSEWNSKAIEALHDRYPSEFPSERQESRGKTVVGDLPFGAPAKTGGEP